MKIEFEYGNFDKIIEFDNLCIFTSKSNEKINQLSQLFIDGINGKLKNFNINNAAVQKNLYNVLFSNNNTNASNEFKLTNKSILQPLIKDIVSNNNKVLEKINLALKGIESEIKQKFEEVEFSNHNLNITMQIPNVMTLVKDILSFTQEPVQTSDDEFLYLKLLINNVKSDGTEFFILNLYNTRLKTDQILEVITAIINKNIPLLLFTDNETILSLFYKRYPLFIVNNKITSIDYFIELFIENNYATYDFIDELSGEKKLVSKSLLFVLLPYIMLIITSENQQIIFDNFKKNKLLDTNLLQKLENFKKILEINELF